MALLDAVLELADDHLVLGHRVSEWVGHAPMLEEDLAMPNMALDLIGAARVLYDQAPHWKALGNPRMTWRICVASVSIAIV